MTTKRNLQTTELSKNDLITSGYYQVNETIFIGEKCYREGEVISLRWDGHNAYVTNSKKKTVKATEEEIDEVAHTFCKTHKITVLEKKMGRIEKKSSHRFTGFALFLDDDTHLIIHKVVIALMALVYMVISAYVSENDNPVIRNKRVTEFIKSPFTTIYGIVFASLVLLYILRKALADPIYNLAYTISNRNYEYEKSRIEKEIFGCGDPMIPVTGRKPILMKPPVKATDSQEKPSKKVFPDLPKIEIQESEIKLEEHNGLFLYRTFWKGKKFRHRNTRANRKDKKIS